MKKPHIQPVPLALTRGRRLTGSALLPAFQPAAPETPLPGYLCEVCQDAPAGAFVPAPWGGEMGICEACGGFPPAAPPAPRDAVPACLICAQPPGPDEDATAYVQHCFDTGHPLRPRGVAKPAGGADLSVKCMTYPLPKMRTRRMTGKSRQGGREET